MKEVTKIEAGCFKLKPANTWKYSFMFQGDKGYTDVYQVELTFTAEEGEVPEIGDFIVGGKLVKRQGEQVNPDYRMWKERFTDTLIKDKMVDPKTW